MVLVDSSVLVFNFEYRIANNSGVVAAVSQKYLDSLVKIASKLGKRETYLTPYIIGETEVVLRKAIVGKIIRLLDSSKEFKTQKQRDDRIAYYRGKVKEFIQYHLEVFPTLESDKLELQKNALRLYKKNYTKNSLIDNLLIADAQNNGLELMTFDSNLAEAAREVGVEVVPEV